MYIQEGNNFIIIILGIDQFAHQCNVKLGGLIEYHPHKEEILRVFIIIAPGAQNSYYNLYYVRVRKGIMSKQPVSLKKIKQILSQ